MLRTSSKLETVALLLGIVIVVLILPRSSRAIGQAATSDTPGPTAKVAGKLEFDAGSVRPSTQEFVLKGGDFLNPASDAAPPQGGLFSWDVQIPWLISFAYDLRSSQARREAREALPKWAQDGWFNVEARAEGNLTRDDVRQMVRSLLEDRFRLAAHRGRREGQIFALMVARPGFGLKPHPDGTTCMLSSSRMDENRFTHLYPPYETVPAPVAF